MDLQTFRRLLTDEGRAALADATALRPNEASYLSCFTRLSKRHPPELARAALETLLLRDRARIKFSRADVMYFTREALEQASGETVSRHRARRFASLRKVGDYCAGVGGDSIGLSEHAEVVAVDRDPLRLAMAAENLGAHGRRERVTFLEDDLTRIPLPDVEGIFLDPGRRAGGRRRLAVSEYEPSLEIIESWRERVPAIGVKLAPGIDLNELSPFGGEQEFLSVEGELKECVLWLGPLRTAERRATLLPGGHSLCLGGAPPAPQVSAPGRYLYDPDPAVLRAGLVTVLAGDLNARQLDPSIAYLTADSLTPTPFARAHAVEEAMPFELKRLREWLRVRRVGRLTVKRRGSPIDPDDLVRRLKLDGPEERVLFLTRVGDRPLALIASPASPESYPPGLTYP
jgi:hypothetical protein